MSKANLRRARLAFCSEPRSSRCARRPRRIRSRCPRAPARKAPSIDGEPRVEARLLALPDDTGARGDFRIGVLFDLDPGWHLYWRDPGESGLATRLDWSVPGAGLEPIAWPAPSAFRESEGLFTTYGYEGRVLLATRAIFGIGAPRERVAKVRAELLVCEVECIPASFALESRLDGAVGGYAVRALFDAAAQRVPLAPTALGIQLSAQVTGDGAARRSRARWTCAPVRTSRAARGSRRASPPSSPIAAAARSSRWPA